MVANTCISIKVTWKIFSRKMSSIRVNNLYDRHIFVRKSVVRFNYFALIFIHETRDFLIVYIASITRRSAEGSDP